MTAGRKPVVFEAQQKPVIDTEAVMGAFAMTVKAEVDAKANAVALAKQLNYEGALTVGGLEEEIKFYQRRCVESVLELGKRLILLKEIAGHGGFYESLEGLGFSPRLAQQFMAATFKFSNAKSTSLLSLPNLSQTKLLELLVLDDGEIESLADGETVRGVTLDDIDCMAVSELRTAMRKAKREFEEAKATSAEMIRRRDERINKLEEENAGHTSKPKPARTPAMDEEERLRFMVDHSLMLVRETQVGLRSHFALLEKLFPDGILPNHVQLAMQQACTQVIQAARVLSGDYGITLKLEDNEPQELLWLTQGEKLFGAASPAEQADDALIDGEGEA